MMSYFNILPQHLLGETEENCIIAAVYLYFVPCRCEESPDNEKSDTFVSLTSLTSTPVSLILTLC
jgi:hypothetical protein